MNVCMIETKSDFYDDDGIGGNILENSGRIEVFRNTVDIVMVTMFIMTDSSCLRGGGKPAEGIPVLTKPHLNVVAGPNASNKYSELSTTATLSTS